MSAEERYYAAKRRAEEIRHAKQVSDQILSMFGLPKYGQAPVKFPGLEQAHEEQTEALFAWQREARGV